MTAPKKIINFSRWKPHSSLKKNGVVWTRYIFTGIDSVSGAEQLFFVEWEMLNAGLFPDESVLGFKPRTAISEDDLQYALAGTEAAFNLRSESIVTPSYVAVRAGTFGVKPKQICSYYALKDVTGGFRLSPITVGNCSFGEEKISGSLSRTTKERAARPEYFCDAGEISWDLRCEIRKQFSAGYKKSSERWIPVGARTAFSGSITLDGREFSVLPKKSYGYIDVHFLRTFPAPYFHISSSNLTSRISGKALFDSSFTVQGIFEDSLALALEFENTDIALEAKKRSASEKILWDCTEMPADEEGERLHWSVSADTKKWVIDIDIVCHTSKLFVRNIELPEGNRKVLKLLAGGNGTGEIKLYRRIGKSLEIIEDAHVAFALCEFGQAEDGEI
ncbi:hypothetical protein [Treponema socranskii]|uniref:hypothetical protein n=1 Tax=Treponema socranskii TaxID=53419 RepID=UPI002872940F|nr:hypothetical protein [Treponema socranskii]MDR9859850.1 hypothetical protein [Treponema socranskii]